MSESVADTRARDLLAAIDGCAHAARSQSWPGELAEQWEQRANLVVNSAPRLRAALALLTAVEAATHWNTWSVQLGDQRTTFANDLLDWLRAVVAEAENTNKGESQ